MKIPLDLKSWNLVKNRIQDLGYVLVREVREEDVYFNSPWRNFADTDEALRIRSIRDANGKKNGEIHHEFTYKGPKQGEMMKIREEVTVRVDDAEKLREVLRCLGFVEVMTVSKNRTYYRREDVLVCLDDVKDLGFFMEIEMLVDGGPLDHFRKKILELVSELLGSSSMIDERRSYLELLLEKKTNIQNER